MNTPSCWNGAVKVIILEYASIANNAPRSKLSLFEISNRNLIGPSYIQFSISNKSPWAHLFNYPIVMSTNISRRAGIGHQLHYLKAKDLMKDKVIEIDWKNWYSQNGFSISGTQRRVLEWFGSATNAPWCCKGTAKAKPGGRGGIQRIDKSTSRSLLTKKILIK